MLMWLVKKTKYVEKVNVSFVLKLHVCSVKKVLRLSV